MRSEKEVRNKIKQVRFRYLKKAIRKALSEFPSNDDGAKEIKKKIENEFDLFLATASPAEIAYRFPDMAALSWVLGIPVSDFFKKSEDSIDEEESDTEESINVKTIREPVEVEIPKQDFLGNPIVEEVEITLPLKSTPVQEIFCKEEVDIEDKQTAIEKTDSFWSKFIPACFKGSETQEKS